MQRDELSAIIKRSEDEYINKWNQTRFIAYSVIQSQSTEEVSIEDIMKFPWEETVDIKNVDTEENRERLKAHALEMQKKLNIKNGKQ